MSRPCKGFLVECKNPAVKGRLFCFTCAGRKSRNKKTLALESFEKECLELRAKIKEMEPELNHWKHLAANLRVAELEAKQELADLKQKLKLMDTHVDLSGAAQALLSIGDPKFGACGEWSLQDGAPYALAAERQ